MKKYARYKDSGISWIGEVPEHWETKRLKYVVSCNDETLSENFDSERQIEYVEIGDVNEIDGIVNSTLYLFKNAPSRARRITRKNDIIVSTVRTYLKAVAKVDKDGLIVSTGFAVLRSKGQNPSYLGYFSKCDGFTSEVLRFSVGMSYPAINNAVLLNFFITIPPLSEQKAIAEYLDKKTAQINELVSAKQKQIELLKEYKQSVIANVVTGKLNKDCRMKDSGISWIGKIPENWEVKRIRHVFNESDEKITDNTGELLSLSQYTGVSLKRDCEKVGMFEAETTEGYKIVHKNQFVMNIMLAWNGSYAVSELEGVISPAYCVFNFIIDCVPKYFHYLLRLKAYAGAFKTLSKGIIDSRLRLYPSKFYTFPVIIPPLSEQKEIVAYIEKKVSSIDSQIESIENQIANLNEYKQSLISDVVTGKVKV